MNGYEMMAESYRRLVNKGLISTEDAEKKIRIYTFLASCDSEDLCILADSGAFNGILKNALTSAMNAANLNEESKENVHSQLRWILDEKSAKDFYNK